MNLIIFTLCILYTLFTIHYIIFFSNKFIFNNKIKNCYFINDFLEVINLKCNHLKEILKNKLI